jgi:aryl-alcohol dehydrogenase-like predicted oxidoreductase
MQYRTLGKTGIKVTPYCLGAMMFGGIANSDHDDCIRIIHKALDFGINFVDTADRYSNGESEEIVGKALKGRRDTIVLATKVHGPMGEDPNQQGNSRRWIVQAVEASLRRLQTDHIDLYQIHRPSPDTDIEETLSALTDLMRAGKVRAIGSSTFPASEIVEAQWVAERRGLARFRTEQPPYSILNRSIEREVLPACQKYGMGALVWSPLAKGMLTGQGSAVARQLARQGIPQADVRRAQPGGDRAPHSHCGGGRAALDPHGDGLRDGAPRRDLGDPRSTHDAAA